MNHIISSLLLSHLCSCVRFRSHCEKSLAFLCPASFLLCAALIWFCSYLCAGGIAINNSPFVYNRCCLAFISAIFLSSDVALFVVPSLSGIFFGVKRNDNG